MRFLTGTKGRVFRGDGPHTAPGGEVGFWEGGGEPTEKGVTPAPFPFSVLNRLERLER